METRKYAFVLDRLWIILFVRADWNAIETLFKIGRAIFGEKVGKKGFKIRKRKKGREKGEGEIRGSDRATAGHGCAP